MNDKVVLELSGSKTKWNKRAIGIAIAMNLVTAAASLFGFFATILGLVVSIATSLLLPTVISIRETERIRSN